MISKQCLIAAGLAALTGFGALASENIQFNRTAIQIESQRFCLEGNVAGKKELKKLKNFLDFGNYSVSVRIGDDILGKNVDSKPSLGLNSDVIQVTKLKESKELVELRICVNTSRFLLVDRTYHNSRHPNLGQLEAQDFGFAVSTQAKFEKMISIQQKNILANNISSLAPIKREATLFKLPDYYALVVDAKTGFTRHGYTVEMRLSSHAIPYTLILRGESNKGGQAFLVPFAEAFIGDDSGGLWEDFAPKLIENRYQFKPSAMDLGGKVSMSVRVVCFNSKFPVKECNQFGSNWSFGDVDTQALIREGGITHAVDGWDGKLEVTPKE